METWGLFHPRGKSSWKLGAGNLAGTLCALEIPQNCHNLGNKEDTLKSINCIFFSKAGTMGRGLPKEEKFMVRVAKH